MTRDRRKKLDTRASETRDRGEALQAIERQPFGSWVLGLVALGLIAFGLFGLVEARFRRIRPPRAIDKLG